MTEATAESSNSRTQLWPAFAPAGIVVAYVVANVLMFWLLNRVRRPSDYIEAFVIGALVVEPISIGIWTALGSGALLTRLPMALLSISLLILSVQMPEPNFGRGLDRDDFLALVLSGTILFTLSTLIFLIVRWFTRFRIEDRRSSQLDGRAPVRFSMKYLLALITLAAIALGMFSQLRFKEPPSRPFLGPEFVYYVMIIGGAILASVSLPTIAVPAFILSQRISKRAAGFAIGFWFIVALIWILILAINEVDEWLEIISYGLLVQLAAAIAGALTAVPLRLAGFRLVRRPKVHPLPEAVAMPNGPEPVNNDTTAL
jgi:hypothetical protein